MRDSSVIAEYLARLRQALRVRADVKERILAEVEDHLLEAAQREQARDIPPEDAQRRVVARFGAVEDVAQWWTELYGSNGAVEETTLPPSELIYWEGGEKAMWQRFTERARRVVFFAQEDAARWGENYVGTEHLLLGLMRETDSVAGKILIQLKIAPEQVRLEAESQMTRGQGNLGQDMQLTPRAKRVIDLAYEEARQLDNNYIGTEHLLLGIIREGDGLGSRVLVKLGADLDRTRHIVRMMQAVDAAKKASAPPAEPTASPTAESAMQPPQEAASPPPAEQPGEIPQWLKPGPAGTPEAAPQVSGEAQPLDWQETARRLQAAGQATPEDAASLVHLLWPAPNPQVKALWAKFTERARRAAYFAQEEAVRFGWNAVATEHLLLGLFRAPVGMVGEKDHIAAQVLERMGVSLGSIRDTVERLAARGQHNPEQPMDATIGALRVVKLTYAEAEALNHNYIGTEHLLLGLLRERVEAAATGGVASEVVDVAGRILGDLGIDLERARAALQAGEFQPLPPTNEAIMWLPPPWLQGTAGTLTQTARRVLLFALEAGPRFGYAEVGVEPLLLGLVSEDNLAARLLGRLGVPLEEARGRVQQLVAGPGRLGELQLKVLREPGGSTAPRLYADAQRVMERAREEAQSLGQPFLGAEHLLLGILRESGSNAAMVLAEMGVTLEKVRAEIPVVAPKWVAILEARRRLDEAEAGYRALLANP